MHQTTLIDEGRFVSRELRKLVRYNQRGTNMTLHNRIRTGLLSVVALSVALVVVVSTPLALAQSSTTRQRNNTNNSAMKVSPLRTDVIIRPGEMRKVTVSVQNVTTKPMTLKAIENDFVAGDNENGIPDIILDEDKYAPTHSLKRFMAPLPIITVPPGERQTVEVAISVPENAQAGGYYGAIRFAPASTDGENNVAVSGSVASLVLLTVPGNTVESLQLTNFDIRQDKKTAKRLASPENVDVLLRLENKGNIHVAPFGSINVQKNGKLVYSAKLNDIKPRGVILPDSARKWTVPIKGLDKFGKYEISATLGYGGSGDTIEVKKSIWIIPTLYIVIAILAIAVLIILIVAIVFSLRAYKRRILRRARRR